MIIEVTEDRERDLAAYASISIAYEVRELFDVSRHGAVPDGFALAARRVDTPYMKDYDADGVGPETWGSRFDLSHWRIFVARALGRRVGGAAVVFRAPDVDMLGGDPELALLWDIRVAPEARGHGVGSALVATAEAWAAANGARWLEIETQNVNVPACRFYSARGYVLRAVDPHAYPSLPNETQLLWRKALDPAG
jgi:GNAT superfamily N-acetyltransferase